jgi:formate hydrogenlyase subunit 4
MDTLFFLIQIISVPVISPLLIGVIRKIKALMQNRVGADIWQPYRDLRKLFQKDEIISNEASWVTRYFPYLIFAITVLLGASVPLATSVIPELVLGEWGVFSLGAVSDFIVIVYLFALTTFLLVLIGMDQGSAFGGFGSSREMMVSALAEGGFFFALFAVSIATQTGNVMDMVSSGMNNLPLLTLLPLFIAFIGFFLVLLAENARFPFDNPATHLELTMIHEAMILDLSGKRLALIK